MNPLRIAFLVPPSTPDEDSRPHLSAVTQEIIAHLQAMGALVDLIVPEREVLEIARVRPNHDAYVLKSKSPLALSLAGALTMLGATIINTYWSSTLARDKIAATAVLAAGGVSVPPSWATGCPALLRPMASDDPIWIKPQRGSRGAGVRLVSNPADVDALEAPTDAHGLPMPLFAQRDMPSSGRDLKVYVVGDQAWAITRPFPARTLADKLGLPVKLSPPIRAAALAVGQALGLELYGVDFVTTEAAEAAEAAETADQFWVVDVNAFPGYKGVPEAPRHIAQYLHESVKAAPAAIKNDHRMSMSSGRMGDLRRLSEFDMKR